MITLSCECSDYKKNGRDRNRNQRYKCKDCGRTWIEDRDKPIGDMRTDFDKAVLALNLSVEGMSVSSVERLTGLHRHTIGNLILTVGANCERLSREIIQDVSVSDVQADEIWSFIGMKDRTRRRLGIDPGEYGDCWTFIAIERNTKLILAYYVSHRRDDYAANKFLSKLKHSVTGRFQMTTDGLASYRWNVPITFRHDVDFAQLIKSYAATQETTRYSPARIIRAEKTARWGNPVPESVCTSHIERFNLTLRMSLRRFTRLTNAFSKSREHHTAMQSIMFAWYNFVRKHQAIGTTPAVKSGVTDHAWAMAELLERAAKA